MGIICEWVGIVCAWSSGFKYYAIIYNFDVIGANQYLFTQLCVKFMRSSIDAGTVCEFIQVRPAQQSNSHILSVVSSIL